MNIKRERVRISKKSIARAKRHRKKTLVQDKIITNKHIQRQKREEIENMQDYKKLMELLK